jgi:hypothetical protein
LVDQTSSRKGCPPKLQRRRVCRQLSSIRSRKLNSHALDFGRRARVLSDIVKRRSIRALHVAVKSRAARTLQSGIRKQGSGIRTMF